MAPGAEVTVNPEDNSAQFVNPLYAKMNENGPPGQSHHLLLMI